jgi:hypothetical protein
MLASSSRDKTIRVWSTRGERAVLVLKALPGAASKRSRQDDGHTAKPWVAACWPIGRPCSLLSSSLRSDLLMNY